MLLRELLEKADTIKIAADLDSVIGGVCYDTRKLKAGDLFVAIKGFESDGHSFIGEAAEKGAVCVICEKPPDCYIPYILVGNSREALASISAAWFGYPASQLKIIGVTGTNGKTTVTNLIKHAIEACAGGHVALMGTNRNMIGSKEYLTERTTPESYELHEFLTKAVEEGCDYAVMEVSSHALILSRVYGIDFEIGVFTNLTADHLDFHSSMEDYARAKAILFKHSRIALINSDDSYMEAMLRSATGKAYTYAINNVSADFIAKNIKLHADRVDFCALTVGQLSRVELPIPGMFSVYNGLAAISAAVLSGAGLDCAATVMQSCERIKGRAEIVPGANSFTVMIDYAHTPDALENIINAARDCTTGRIVTLFGCGGDRDKTKRPKMGEIAQKLSNYIIITSDNPRTEEPGAIIDDIISGIDISKKNFTVIENRREAINWSLENACLEDVIILAGKGHETYQIIGKEKRHFDEREVVAEYFDKLKNEN